MPLLVTSMADRSPLLFYINSHTMARVVVYRSGNASSPRFDNFRDKDFTIDSAGNLVPS